MHIDAISKLGIEIEEVCQNIFDNELADIVPKYSCGSFIKADDFPNKNHFSANNEDNKDCPHSNKSTVEIAFIRAQLKTLKNSSITLKFPSVGATENLLLASTFSNVVIHIKNAAREPEIVALQNFLNGIGAKITGAGTSHIIIHPCNIKGTDTDVMLKKNIYQFSIPSDRIECGTYILAGAICCGVLTFKSEAFENQYALLSILKNSIELEDLTNKKKIYFLQNKSISNVFVTTPYPGIATDLQSPLSAFFCTVDGKNHIVESIFQNRVAHLDELIKMGAKISRYKNYFTIEGQTQLHGAKVTSNDLRGGAALILAGLGAIGTTEVIDNSYITRGYTNIDLHLSQLGADIHKKQIDI